MSSPDATRDPFIPEPIVTINTYRKLAAAIDHSMRLLATTGVSGTAVIGPMLGQIAALQQIRTAVSDEQLALLFEAYPEFHRYASLMEEGKEVDFLAANKLADGSAAAELSASLKKPLTLLLMNGTAIERGFQSVLDEAGQPGWRKRVSELARLHRGWSIEFDRYKTTLIAATISEELLRIAIEPLERLSRQISVLEAHARGDRDRP